MKPYSKIHKLRTAYPSKPKPHIYKHPEAGWVYVPVKYSLTNASSHRKITRFVMKLRGCNISD